MIGFKLPNYLKFIAVFIFLIENNETVLSQDKVVNREIYKVCNINNLGYNQIISENVYTNLKMIGYVTKNGVQGVSKQERLYGMILRALSFQNISMEVEKRYQLSKNLILAMVIQETGGADILTNGSNDGGVGLCHMQPLIASNFGLKTYKDCKRLVSKEHGRAINKLIKLNHSDRKALINYDDRFHPIKNLDAVGRILSFYKDELEFNLSSPEKRSIRGYAGSVNYKKYYKNIKYFQRLLNDDLYIDKVRKEFNRRNPNLKINGVRGDFDLYIKSHQDQNINYGLLSYIDPSNRKSHIKESWKQDSINMIINQKNEFSDNYNKTYTEYLNFVNETAKILDNKSSFFIIKESKWFDYIKAQCLFESLNNLKDMTDSTLQKEYFRCLSSYLNKRKKQISNKRAK